jgi:LEA14-like dessication related protein
MKTGTVLLLGVGAVAAYYFAQLGKAGSTMQIVLSGVQVNSVTDYVITLTFQNVSNATVKINSFTGVVSINDNQVGNVSEFGPVIINPNSQQAINIHFSPSLLSLPGAIRDLLNNSGGELVFNVNGNANVDNLVLPVNVSDTVTV